MDVLTNVAPRRCSRIDSDDHAAFEAESERRRSVLDFDAAGRVCMVVGMQSQEVCRLQRSQRRLYVH